MVVFHHIVIDYKKVKSTYKPTVMMKENNQAEHLNH